MDENDEAARAWNTILFDKFCRFRSVLLTGCQPHGEAAIARRPPAPGARVLDVGCGFGDMTLDLARRVGPSGEAVGVDVAERFTRAGGEAAAEEGIANARFVSADVQIDALSGPYDAAYSRFGTMFFASPGAALRNVKKSLKPGGSWTMVVWRKREDNPWIHVAEQCARALVPDNHDARDVENDPTCGPGPFSMRGPDLVSDLHAAAGFREIGFERHDIDICIGHTLDEAIEFALELGPAGELIRLAGDEGQRQLPRLKVDLADALEPYVSPKGVYAPSSSWIVTARA